jgi:hypothetical protein
MAKYTVRAADTELAYEEPGLGGEIIGELIKSYGFSRDDNGDLGWSLENIGKAFHDDPFFTAVDWALLLPPLAWGKAAMTVGKGTGAAGRAYKGASAAGRVGGIPFREAVRMEQKLAPRTRVGRWASSPITGKYDEGTLKFLDDWRGANGALDPSDVHHIGDQIMRDERFRMSALQRKYEGSVKEFAAIGWSSDEALDFHNLMKTSKAEFPDQFAAMEARLSYDQQRFFQNTWNVRNTLHLEAQENFLFGPETAAKHGGKWWARGYVEREPQKALKGKIARLHHRRGERHFMARKTEEAAEEFTEITDPLYGVTEMFQAAATLERQKTLVAFGNSMVAKTEGQILSQFGTAEAALEAGWLRPAHQFRNLLNRSAPGLRRAPVALTRMRQRSTDAKKEYDRLQKLYDRVSPTAVRAGTKGMGRSVSKGEAGRIRRRLEQARGRMKRTDTRLAKMEEVESRHHFLRAIPDDIANKYLDPAVAEDVRGYLNWHEKNGNVFAEVYYGMQQWFKKVHVPYNPATVVRNFLGGILFHSFSVGLRGGLKLFPNRGVSALRGRKYQAEATRFIDRGGLSMDPDTEVLELIEKAMGGDVDRVGGIPGFLGKILKNEDIAAWMAKGDLHVRRFYSAIDDAWKLESYIALENRFRKGAKVSIREASERATLDTWRYHPNYGEGSPFMQAIRPHVPFVSFPLEAARVWKNAFLYRPHMAILWNHMAEMGTEVSAAVAGFSPQEMETARESLPWYTKGKKMLALPWRDADDKIHFIDLSYIIPAADLGSEAQQSQNRFLGIPIPPAIDPTSNPLINLAAAGALQTDPFSGRPIEPRFAENYLGLRTTSPGTRRFFGLAEHTASLLLPPAIPPAYVGTNLVEMLTGRMSGVTGEKLEENAYRTIAANLFGLRTYEPTVRAQIANIRHEQREIGDRLTKTWDRWEAAVANEDLADAEAERQLIIQLRNEERGDGLSYFQTQKKRHIPGRYGNVGRRELSEILRRSTRFGAGPDEIGPIYLRWIDLHTRR